VDDARDLRERAFFAPVSDRYKIYIIDEAHMVTPGAFNALLKLVEEPPEFVKFVFATTEPEKVLQTIRSRTHHYPFRLMSPKALTELLTEVADAEASRSTARSSRWSYERLPARRATACRSWTRCWPAPGRGRHLPQRGRACSASPTTRCSTRRSTRWPPTTPGVFRAVDRVVEAGHDPAASPPTCSTGCAT
jgi:DNA polymerase-3 subunit gamma/tau